MNLPVYDPTPILAGAQDRTIQQNFESLVEWIRSLQVALNRELWTTTWLGANFATADALARAVGVGFDIEPRRTYQIRGCFLLRTTSAAVGPRPGLQWPSGVLDGAFRVTAPTGATSEAMLNSPMASGFAASTGLPTTDSYLATMDAIVVAGTSPGRLELTLASETAGTTVSMRAGSWLAYRAQ